MSPCTDIAVNIIVIVCPQMVILIAGSSSYSLNEGLQKIRGNNVAVLQLGGQSANLFIGDILMETIIGPLPETCSNVLIVNTPLPPRGEPPPRPVQTSSPGIPPLPIGLRLKGLLLFAT